MKIKQKVVNNVTLPVGLSGKGNGIWDGIGISFGKITAFATRNLVWYTLIMSVVTEMVSAMVSALTKTGGSSESLISEVTGTAASAGMIAGVFDRSFLSF